MKKIKPVEDKHEEIVILCKSCLAECRWGQNDWDSFVICDECDKTDFVGDLKWFEARKVTKYTTHYEKI